MSERSENLACQSLGRPLEQSEIALADALKSIFGSGQHDFSIVVEELQKRGIARPSGEDGPWSVAVMEVELKVINASLDAAHDAGGITLLN